MGQLELTQRLLCAEARVDSRKVRTGQLTESDWGKIAHATGRLADAPIWIDDNPNVTIMEIRAKARRLRSRLGDLGLIVVDYLQLLGGSARKAAEGRVQEVSEITVGLKALAKELNVPVLALSQLSRQVEQREDKRPMLSDLRESGSIEQDADMVWFVYREDYYELMKKPDEGTPAFDAWNEKMERIHGVAELIISKQRHGSTGRVRMKFEAKITRFSDLADDQYADARYD